MTWLAIVGLLHGAQAAEVRELGRKVRALEVSVVNGDLRVLRADPAARAVSLSWKSRFDDGRQCRFRVEEEKKSAAIRFAHVPPEDPKHCLGALTLRLPAGVSLVVDVGVGDVQLDGLDASARLQVDEGDVQLVGSTAPVRVQIGTGTLRLREVAGSVEADVEAGDVRGDATGRVKVRVAHGSVGLSGLRSVVDADVGTGHIALDFAAAPAGTIVANTAQGNIVVDLPASTPVAVEMVSGKGTTTCELPTDPAAATRLHAVTGVGAVKVRPR